MGGWKPLVVAKKVPKLSHLFFVDDLVLFAKASLDQVAIISKVLDKFCQLSGHRISKEKIVVFFSKNTNRQMAQQIGEGFGFKITNDMRKYLRVPIIHGRTTRVPTLIWWIIYIGAVSLIMLPNYPLQVGRLW